MWDMFPSAVQGCAVRKLSAPYLSCLVYHHHLQKSTPAASRDSQAINDEEMTQRVTKMVHTQHFSATESCHGPCISLFKTGDLNSLWSSQTLSGVLIISLIDFMHILFKLNSGRREQLVAPALQHGLCRLPSGLASRARPIAFAFCFYSNCIGFSERWLHGKWKALWGCLLRKRKVKVQRSFFFSQNSADGDFVIRCFVTTS